MARNGEGGEQQRLETAMASRSGTLFFSDQDGDESCFR